MDRIRRDAPYILLAATLLAAATATLVLASQLTYFGDTWNILMSRNELTADNLFDPHNSHIIAIVVLVGVGSLEIFGMTSAMPEFVVLTLALCLSALLIFIYAERRVGPWLALFAVAVLLFLGPAWEAILWPFELIFIGSILFGTAMLLALDRETRRGDILACVFLAASMASSTVGVAFLVAAAGDIVVKRERRPALSRLFVVAVPFVLFALWYLVWGSQDSSDMTLRNLLSAPRFLAETGAFTLGSLVGLGASPYGAPPDPSWGRVLAIVGLIAVGLRLRSRPELLAGLLPVAAALATYWLLTGANLAPGRDPTTSRYLYASAALVILVVVNVLRDVRPSRTALVVTGAIALCAVTVNAVVLKDGQGWFRDQTVLARSNLAAIEIARASVADDFQLSPDVAGTTVLIDISAGNYLHVAEEHGSPAYTESELLDAPEAGRRQADIVLARALPLTTGPAPAGRLVDCRPAVGDPATGVALEPGTSVIEVDPGAPASVALRRFATVEFPVPALEVPGGGAMSVHIPEDASSVPWHLQVSGVQGARVCRPS